MHIRAGALAVFVVAGVAPLLAQDTPQRVTRDTVIELPEMSVTATRDLREVFRTPAPVSVVDSTTLARRTPASVTDLFHDLPGLDVNGVGPSQSRPVIRGLLGQRILLLQDGLRMNNSRRESDFGEIPSLVGLEALGRVEVVRGPTSVLYGTDAIGGAVNLITRQPPQALGPTTVHGAMGYRFQGAGDQQRPFGLVTGTAGRFSFLGYGSYRDAGSYIAPPGTFGKLTVTSGTPGAWRPASRTRTMPVRSATPSTRPRHCSAGTSAIPPRMPGFGYVKSADLGNPFSPDIIIRYPRQAWTGCRWATPTARSAPSWPIDST